MSKIIKGGLLVVAFLAGIGLVAPMAFMDSESATNQWKKAWPKTDFSKTAISLAEITSGGPPKDGIPSIDKPEFISFSEADSWLGLKEPVVSVDLNGEARAYPIQILIWHEIVNDSVGGRPVSVTFCPLCNSSIVFDRRLNFKGKSYLLDFGTTGSLRKSDMVMYDRQTESWWQQFVGEAIVGELMGAELKMLPSNLISYASFKASYPAGKVLSKRTGHMRNYGKNPYAGYDNINHGPLLFNGAIDKRLPPMEKIVNVTLDGVNKIYPLMSVSKAGVISDTVGKTKVVLFHLPGTVSALDNSTISLSRDVGAATVFHSILDGKELTFRREGRCVCG